MLTIEKIRKYVYVRTQFEGFHKWVNAPISVDFLRNPHRHIFHVRMWIEVQGSDREVEFILLKRRLEDYIKNTYIGVLTLSCEQIAEEILHRFKASMVEVSEDGENGALVSCETEDIRNATHLQRTLEESK